MTGKSEHLIPEGLWVMIPERSKRLVPGTHTLWIVKNDGKVLMFASVETDVVGAVKFTSWQGEYDGPPVEVIGSGMMASLTAPAAGQMLITGEIPEMGPFSEHCIWSPESNTLVCRGRVETPDGQIEYLDDFDYFGPTPAP